MLAIRQHSIEIGQVTDARSKRKPLLVGHGHQAAQKNQRNLHFEPFLTLGKIQFLIQMFMLTL